MAKTTKKTSVTLPNLLETLMEAHTSTAVEGDGPPKQPKNIVAQAVENCLATLTDRSKPAKSRAEFLVLFINEIGYDLLGPVTSLLERLDACEDLEKKVAELTAKFQSAETEKARPLRPEIFVRHVELADGPAHLLQTQGA